MKKEWPSFLHRWNGFLCAFSTLTYIPHVGRQRPSDELISHLMIFKHLDDAWGLRRGHSQAAKGQGDLSGKH